MTRKHNVIAFMPSANAASSRVKDSVYSSIVDYRLGTCFAHTAVMMTGEGYHD